MSQHQQFSSIWMQMFCAQQGKNNLGKFDPRSDEGIFLGSHHLVDPLEFLIKELYVLRNLSTWYLMNLTEMLSALEMRSLM